MQAGDQEKQASLGQLATAALSRLERGASPRLGGLPAAAQAWWVATVAETLPRPVVWITESLESAEHHLQNLRGFCGGRIPRLFPHWDTLPYDRFSPQLESQTHRLEALTAILEGEPVLLVVTAQALLHGTIPATFICEGRIALSIGKVYPRRDLIAQLVAAGYVRVDLVETAGEFSVRGDLVDVYAPHLPHPVRLDFFDEELEGIRRFEVESQKSFESLEQVALLPAGELVVNPVTTQQALRGIPHHKSHVSPEQYRQIHALIERGTPFPGAEQLMPLYYGELGWLEKLLPPETLIFIDEPGRVEARLRDAWEEVLQEYELTLQQGSLALPPELLYRPPEAVRQALARFQRVEQEAPRLEDKAPGMVFPFVDNLALRSLALTDGADQASQETGPGGANGDSEGSGGGNSPVARLARQLARWRNQGAEIFLTARSQTAAERLRHVLEECDLATALAAVSAEELRRGIGLPETPTPAATATSAASAARAAPVGTAPQEVRIPHKAAALQKNAASQKAKAPQTSSPAEIQITWGPIASGLRVVDEQGVTRLALITEAELMGEKARPRQVGKSRLQHFVSSLGELREGDTVVHVEYGLGRYEGLQRIKAGPHEGDFLVLQYAGGDKVYVPVDKFNQVQKYSGLEGTRPTLSKLGDGAWQKTKQKAARYVKELATELVGIQAARQAQPGFEFIPDAALGAAFEEAFPYQETEDQLRAIEDVQADMRRDSPMDRLVCGDVGYGKTEVAMRAAYLAAQNSKQTLVLVPTTILTQQHFDTFRARFDGFPVTVESVSRLRPAAEQREVLRQFNQGQVDILIGTHRLLSKDVQAKELGLLVVDEEQRFGVAHKEKIKRWRTQIDVLTLSATPIPRTLHMALMGVRDLSIINTAPMDRIAVRTRLVKSSDYILREAVQRERRRGGQVFLVHNRVETIHAYGNYIRSLLPDVRLAVAHGQMAERGLERVMLQFVEGEIDVLLSTTIIESGLDIPRANTILIDQADRFGLAQLYQMRGRVGRSHLQAYAYLLVSPEKVLSDVAQKRLSLLQELNDLGAGFRIASHDLEIRGAGNLLGAEQSGNINAVGLELFTRMVEDAVTDAKSSDSKSGDSRNRDLRNRAAAADPAAAEPATVALDLGFEFLLPDEYIASTRQRLDFYKQLADISEDSEIWTVRETLEDRYGQVPPAVDALLTLVRVRLEAKQCGLARLARVQGQLVAEFADANQVDLERLMVAVNEPGTVLQLLPNDRLALGKMPNTPAEVLKRLRYLHPLMARRAA